MSEAVPTPSDLIRSNAVDMEPMANEITTPAMFRLVADVMESLKNGVDNPGAVRLEIGQQKLSLKHNTDVVLEARKPNGMEMWNVSADHYIRRVFNPQHVKFPY